MEVKTILKTKKHAEVVDPPRYPNIINGYEDTAKRMFSATLGTMIGRMTKKMVDLKK